MHTSTPATQKFDMIRCLREILRVGYLREISASFLVYWTYLCMYSLTPLMRWPENLNLACSGLELPLFCVSRSAAYFATILCRKHHYRLCSLPHGASLCRKCRQRAHSTLSLSSAALLLVFLRLVWRCFCRRLYLYAVYVIGAFYSSESAKRKRIKPPTLLLLRSLLRTRNPVRSFVYCGTKAHVVQQTFTRVRNTCTST